MNSQQPPKEALCSLRITPFLEEYISDFFVLINSSPQIMLLSLDLHQDLINEENIAASLMFSPEVSRKLGTEIVAPQTNYFIAYCNTPLRQQILDISMA